MCNCENNSCCNQQEEDVEEFEIFKEYPIGGFFRLNEYVFKVVSDTDSRCRGCDCGNGDEDIRENFGNCAYLICSEEEREDCTPVKFILYDTIPENE